MEKVLDRKEKLIDIRSKIPSYIKDNRSRILEIGPLNRPLLKREDYENYFFADIRDTEEIKALYSGNKYLEDTGIEVDTESIVDIDFVIKGSYEETFKNVEKFDYVIASHVLEHIPDLLNFFLEVKKILKKNGKLIIIYPDKRFCFDYFRSETKFADVYNVYINGTRYSASQVLDFYTNVLRENNPSKYWKVDEFIDFNKKINPNKNLLIFKKVLAGKNEKDVHFWPFSDAGFIKFLYDCSLYGVFPISILSFIPTQINTQGFLVILSFEEGTRGLSFRKTIRKARNYYIDNFYKIGDLQRQNRIMKERYTELIRKHKESENERLLISRKDDILKKENKKLEEERDLLKQRNTELEKENKKLGKEGDLLKQREVELNLRNSKLEETISSIENSKSWRITKPLRSVRRILKKQR